MTNGSASNRYESKYFNTAICMDEALLKLLEKKDFDYITVSEVCKTAGVNRSTFYLHYEEMNDLLTEAINYKFKDFLTCFSGTKTDINLNTENLSDLVFIRPQYLKPYLNFIKDNKKLYYVAINKPAVFKVNKITSKITEDLLYPLLDRFHVEEKDKKYILCFYMNGVQAIVHEWVQNDCEDDIDYIIKLMEESIAYNKRVNEKIY